jgi:hypothetical protein
MLAAKSLALPHAASARSHRNRIVEPFWALARSMTSEHLDRWQRNALEPKSQPVGLLTGLPRSGTTLLERMLAAHPQIVTGDEWDAFPRLIVPSMLGPLPLERLNIDTLDRLPELHLARKRNVYFRFLSAALGQPLSGRWFVDKNPSLLPLIPMYKRLIPSSHLIVALRDPRDVLISSFMTHFPLNDFSVDFLSLDTAADRVVADLNCWLVQRDQIREGCIEVRYEDLICDWQETTSRILHALGIEWQDELLGYREQAERGQVNSPSYDSVYQRLYVHAVGRWRHYGAYIEPELSKFDHLLDALGYPR